MACGTGKTLVALWTGEQSRAQNILVLVPSFSLLQQTLEVWARNQKWGRRFRYLTVCSDLTVAREVDSIVLDPHDLSFPVSTEATEVERFLSAADDAVKVIFSTYQSSPVVGEGSKGFRRSIWESSMRRIRRPVEREQNSPLRCAMRTFSFASASSSRRRLVNSSCVFSTAGKY
jgi:hypothetical protein